MESDSTGPRAQANREKRWVAFTSVLAAVLLTAMKLAIGLWTGSLGILAEALHSGLDLVAAAMTLWAVRLSGQPADGEHTYGHGKYENLSALFETLLLLATCVWIVYEACCRLFGPEKAPVDVNAWSFAVMIISIAVDATRSRALRRAAEKYNSQALEADALHFSTDIWSSAVVLVGLASVLAAEYFQQPWLHHADSVAALGVAAIVIGVSIRLGKKAVNDLLDAVPRGLRERAAAAARVEGVKEVRLCRVRRSGADTFADLTVSVNHAASFEQTHAIAERAEAAVRAVLPGATVMVHVEPVAELGEDLFTTVRVLAARHGLGAHSVRVYEEDGGRALELHLEVEGKLDLNAAHQRATAFEQELRSASPDLIRVDSHLEPAEAHYRPRQAEKGTREQVQAAIREFIKEHRLGVLPHDLQVQVSGTEVVITLHCSLAAVTSIGEAHALTERLERHLRATVPGVRRVIIHAEPLGEGAHSDTRPSDATSS